MYTEAGLLTTDRFLETKEDYKHDEERQAENAVINDKFEAS